MTMWTFTSTLDLLGQAAAPAGDAATTAAVQVQSIWDFLVKGGPMMIPIGLCSLVALAVFVERAISLRRRNVIPPNFLTGLRGVFEDRRSDRDQALAYCKADGSPIAHIVAVGVKRLGEPIELLERHIQEAGEREVLALRKYLRLLSVIASIAPLMGLLGTIFGMINAFQTVAASGSALGKTELLAEGIYEAMITTAAGLLVTIPVLIAYHWISAKIERLVSDMDCMTVEFVEQYAQEETPRGAGGTASSPSPDIHPRRPSPDIHVGREPEAARDAGHDGNDHRDDDGSSTVREKEEALTGPTASA